IAGLHLLAFGREAGDLEALYVGQWRRFDVGRVDCGKHARDLDSDHQLVALDLCERRFTGGAVARSGREHRQHGPPGGGCRYRAGHRGPPPSTTSPPATPSSAAQPCASHAPSVTSRSSPLAIRTFAGRRSVLASAPGAAGAAGAIATALRGTTTTFDI